MPLSELGPDLEQVRGDLTSLISFGFGIEQHPYRGASYVGPADRLCPDQIEHELANRWVGQRIVVWNRVTSTNDLAARAGGPGRMMASSSWRRSRLPAEADGADPGRLPLDRQS